MSLVNEALRKAQQERAIHSGSDPVAEHGGTRPAIAHEKRSSVLLIAGLFVASSLLLGIFALLIVLLLGRSEPEGTAPTAFARQDRPFVPDDNRLRAIPASEQTRSTELTPPSTPTIAANPVTSGPTNLQANSTVTKPPVQIVDGDAQTSATQTAIVELQKARVEAEEKLAQERLLREAAEAEAAAEKERLALFTAQANLAKAQVAAKEPANTVPQTPSASRRDIEAWLSGVRVSGVRISSRGNKTIINSEPYMVGDLVNYDLDLRVASIEQATITFENAQGKQFVKRF